MKRIHILFLIGILPLIFSCSDESKLLVPIPNDITFNELSLSPYSHVIPENGFTSKGVRFNTKKNSDGSYSGFAYSNQNNRSFVWSDSKAARDTNLFSAWTTYRNMTEVFAVACADDEEETYFELSKPTVVEHILVTNTTYNYLAMTYGVNSTSVIANPNIPSAPRALWLTYAPGVTRRLNLAKDYYKIVVKGYNGNNLVGTVNVYLCCRSQADPENPTFNFIRADWIRADLSSLGEVTKVTFSTDCSYKDTSGKDLIHSWFCMDGIRLKK